MTYPFPNFNGSAVDVLDRIHDSPTPPLFVSYDMIIINALTTLYKKGCFFIRRGKLNMYNSYNIAIKPTETMERRYSHIAQLQF